MTTATGMIVSRGNYTREVQAIQSSNGTAAYLSTPPNLVDGIPSSVCAIQWPSGVQSAATYIHIPWRMTPAPTTECRIFALLGLDGIPADTYVELYSGATSNPATLRAARRTVTLPDGSVGLWIVRAAGGGWTDEYWAWRIYNNVTTGVLSPIAASATVYVGEVWSSPAWEWPINRINIESVDQSLSNRSDRGVLRRVPREPYRVVEASIVPKDWDAAMIGADSLAAFQRDLQGQERTAVIVRPRWNSGGSISSTAVHACAILGSLSRAGGLASEAMLDRAPLTVGFEETL